MCVCVCVYVYICIYLCIFIELPWLENSANTYMRHREQLRAVSTLQVLLSSAYRNLHHWRSNQQAQKSKLNHWATGPYHT